MLCKLSLSNIKKSIKDYAIYFVTLVLGVCIFYIFNSVDSQTAMLSVEASKSEMIGLLTELLSYVSVFVSFILGFLIIYASRFLIKKRNKEFGIYMTLGMSKGKISRLLLIETFLIGVISLAVGLFLGVILSQVTSIFVANMFEASMDKFVFNFSMKALVKTIIYFGVIYFIVMIFNTIIINKNKLINLLHANKKQEKVKIRNPIKCIILFIISILMLGVAYYLVTAGIDKLLRHSVNILLVPILLGIFGTVLFFYSVAGLILRVLSGCHGAYYKGLNTFIFKQISSKINTMVISISMICIMLFFTLCLLSSAFTIKNYFNNSINKYAPVDFEMIWYHDSNNDKLDNQEIVNLLYSDLVLKGNIINLVSVSEYYDDEFLYKESLGDYYSELVERYPLIDYQANVGIMTLTDYNKMADLLKFDRVKLGDNEYVIVSNYEEQLYNFVLSRGNVIKVFNHELIPAKEECVEGFSKIGGNPSNIGFIVVPDIVIDSRADKDILVFGNYSVMDKDVIDKLDNRFADITEKNNATFDTKNDIRMAATGLSSIITFISLYLGIIFLISSSAILALKELSDCLDDKNKYKILRQIGVSENDINKSLFKQTLIFFMMPLLLAIVHTIFGLKFCVYILNSLGVENILSGSVVTFMFLIFIYGIYFIVTYLCNKNIIRDE